MDTLTTQQFILLDDDELVLKLETQLLKKLGVSKVYSFDSVKKFFPEFPLFNTSTTVLLCDLKLPDVDGVELIRFLAEKKYEGYLLIVSGADHKIIESVVAMAKGLKLKVLGSIQKPINSNLFFKALQKLQYKEQKNIVLTNYDIDEHDLREALANEEIYLAFQPKINVKDGKLIGAEVLARWKHPKYGNIPPLVFIELAEKAELISDVTFYVLNKTFKQLSKWGKEHLHIPVSVNISEQDLKYLDLPENIIKLSQRYGVDPSLLTIEITESCLMIDLPKKIDVISRLRIRNIGLSIDDFGTGYSSLEKLRDLPFTELKIDKTFVQNILNNQDDYNIVKSNIELARLLGLKTVAEGVEEKEQLDILTQLGCDIIQGYYYSEPLVADDFEQWGRQHQAVVA